MSPNPVVCPRCSTPFECGVDTGGCWCKGVTLNDTTRTSLAEFYNGCLCQACLTSIESTRPPTPSVRQFLVSQLKRRRG